jgi:signal transduction histidine kinase
MEPAVQRVGLLDAVPLPAMVVAGDDTMVGWNPTAAAVFGVPADGVLGRKLHEVDCLSCMTALREAVAESRHGRRRVVREVPVSEASPAPTQVSATPIADSADDASATLVIVEDSAPRAERDDLRRRLADAETRRRESDEALAARQAELSRRLRELAEAQRLDRNKDEFLAMLAHELRNPLAPILSAMHVLHRTAPSDPTARRARMIVERQVSHLARLLDDLLDLSRVTQGSIELRREPVDLVTVAGEALEMAEPLTRRGRQEVRTSWPGQPVVVDGDRARLLQIVGNLLTNAAKYTGPGGEIGVSIEVEGGDAVLGVTDTGIGIPPEMLPRIFELFTQVDPSIDRARGGLGIGLTLVRRLVELHGGSVTAHSAGLGRGSRFTVRLPRSAATPIASGAPAAGGGSLGRVRVLVVDDNGDSREMLRTALEMDGHHVMTAADGLDAGVIATDFEPDLVFLDIGLPGIDGCEVGRRLRTALGRRTVIVALTGYGDDQTRQRVAEAGFDGHVLKPITSEDLAGFFGEVARRRRGRESS